MNTFVNDCTEQKPWLFKPGQSGNPAGRPKGAVSGRMQALQTLDNFMGETDTQQALSDALRTAFHKDPFGFFERVLMKLFPTEALHKIQAENVVRSPWVSIPELCRLRDIEKLALEAGLALPPATKRNEIPSSINQ